MIDLDSSGQIWIINGPNLNLLGKRQPEIYGHLSFEDYLETLRQNFYYVPLLYFQSNHEGSIIDQLHHVGFSARGIILNAGAYSHTSIAIADAISSIQSPAIEVHISDISKRETFRHHSFLTAVCRKHFIGHGMNGYNLAVEWILKNTEPKL